LPVVLLLHMYTEYTLFLTCPLEITDIYNGNKSEQTCDCSALSRERSWLKSLVTKMSKYFLRMS